MNLFWAGDSDTPGKTACWESWLGGSPCSTPSGSTHMEG